MPLDNYDQPKKVDEVEIQSVFSYFNFFESPQMREKRAEMISAATLSEAIHLLDEYQKLFEEAIDLQDTGDIDLRAKFQILKIFMSGLLRLCRDDEDRLYAFEDALDSSYEYASEMGFVETAKYLDEKALELTEEKK